MPEVQFITDPSDMWNARFDERQEKVFGKEENHKMVKKCLAKNKVTKQGKKLTMMGLEPTFSDPKSDALPLSYTAS